MRDASCLILVFFLNEDCEISLALNIYVNHRKIFACHDTQTEKETENTKQKAYNNNYHIVNLCWSTARFCFVFAAFRRETIIIYERKPSLY